MRISRLRRVLLGTSLLSCLTWTSLPARAQRQDPAPQRREAVRCASSDDATPNGLAVVIPPGEKGYKSGNLEVLNNPFVSGVSEAVSIVERFRIILHREIRQVIIAVDLRH